MARTGYLQCEIAELINFMVAQSATKPLHPDSAASSGTNKVLDLKLASLANANASEAGSIAVA